MSSSIWPITLGEVYFLRVVPDGPIKIGFTSVSVKSRIRAARQLSPHEIEFVGSFAGTPTDERAIQAQLISSRLKGEWFHPTDDVLSIIRERCKTPEDGAVQ